MLAATAKAWRYVFGPNVERIHKSFDEKMRAYNYIPNDIEKNANRFLTVAYFIKYSVYYSSPLIVVILWKKKCFWRALCDVAYLYGYGTLIIGGAQFVRAFGRTRNADYRVFMDTLQSCINNPQDKKRKALLRRYDFDFEYWPVDYVVSDETRCKGEGSFNVLCKRLALYRSFSGLVLCGLPKELTAFVAAHTFGVSLMYPGFVGLFKMTCASSMRSHRSQLIEERNGLRAKLKTGDGNFIDTMFVDRRTKVIPLECSTANPDFNKCRFTRGYTLVICSEGNAGFYECGCMTTPLDCGYSVLGWNHPGFMCSTGRPYPCADVCALDAVLEYAIRVLGFPQPNIILFGWSVGCFSVIKVAPRYPEIKGIVLDSPFHDALVFAKLLLPSCCELLATRTVRNYLDMNNMINLRAYRGPVLFIRREKDEVMNIDHLLNKWEVYSGESRDFLVQSMCERKTAATFPMKVGKGLTAVQKSRCVLFLASQYMHHFDSSHCNPLPPNLFSSPFKVEDLLTYSDNIN